ncbi:1,3-beta-D-glucan synthase [Tieghemiomyces parasiticus]|uniref:1,3-beta-glucan synthase n=1 Tax=Tieghemiomyces parasiticus TaxID=78921 RepID=A0A9W8AG25_9FUNG|nr:1,3-beta-D-glucan synthase [Tieghemiomyces parasiticus]
MSSGRNPSDSGQPDPADNYTHGQHHPAAGEQPYPPHPVQPHPAGEPGEPGYYDMYDNYDEYANHRPESFDVSYYARNSGYSEHDYLPDGTYLHGEGSSGHPGGFDPHMTVPDGHVVRGQQTPKSAKGKGIPRGPGSESDDMSDGAFSVRSSLVRTPNSVGGHPEVDLMRQARIDDGRYASYAPSAESLIALLENKKAFRPTGSMSSFSRTTSWVSASGAAPYFDFSNPERFEPTDHPYPSWSDPNQVPISKDEIEDVFKDLGNKFGFQSDSVRNQCEALLTQLDSRASRMSPGQALLTLHADYLGGDHANYRRWYFSAQLDRDTPAVRTKGSNKSEGQEPDDAAAAFDLEAQETLRGFEEHWRTQMNAMSQYDRVRQLALYLCLWGEACVLRFTSECLCFLFKCAWDHLQSPACQARVEPVPEGTYLRDLVTPLYMFCRDETYEVVNGRYLKRERDHAQTVGYDDINELFWTPDDLRRLTLEDKSKLMDLPPADRWERLKEVRWKKAFYKTYKERRTFMHLITNFSRIWVIHISVYYYYMMYNADFMYGAIDTTDPTNANTTQPDITGKQLSLMAVAGAIASLITIISCICELFFVPWNWKACRIIFRRIGILFIFFVICLGPTPFVYNFSSDPTKSIFTIAKVVGILQFVFSLIVTITLSVVPLGKLFKPANKDRNARHLANPTFTSNFPPLRGYDRALSLGLWGCIFLCKFVESYFFLALSFKDVFKSTYNVVISGCTTPFLGNILCSQQGVITLALMLMLDQVLFFLDTYLWYVIWNTIFSVLYSFQLGISIWSPWRNIFSRLPKRVYAKMLATADMEIKYKPKVLCSQIWNAVVISMYREHLLSVDHVQKLLYQQVPSEEDGKRILNPPHFFVSQEDTSIDTEFYPPNSEAERRIAFFAQSLATVMPEPIPVENMPTFTVLTPHYSEKILLSLREIIRENDQLTRVTMLEYLKALHPVEWDNFVKDTKILAEENSDTFGGSQTGPFPMGGDSDKTEAKAKTDDLPFYSIGFKSAAPEFTLRTRIWASLRSQTLYRTISGFMNYAKAIKLLYRVESPEMVHVLGGNGSEKLEKELERMARRKFKFIVSMQRFTKFSKEESEAVSFLLGTYPDLQIAYLEEVASEAEGELPRIFSCLIDGHSEVLPDGRFKPYYRIELPGNPILGDGKSDNQNHSVIFYRGEYMQLIDANQDNYLEEALKIRNVLGEFEQYNTPSVSPYSPAAEPAPAPVAIVGAREYIFSQNVGILGDVAAGKEATFGTLTQRIMAKVGGKLHYGHPDFLNAIFMTTRGGISKAQKGLHLNEDIYAGMNAFERGGRIKHVEYFQCGKGRDLGFCSCLNFVTKIGTGMGEQMLSREQYWIGTQLPIDRFLTFFYAHPGFHVNNIFILFSVQLFMLVMVFVSSLKSTVTMCDTNSDGISLKTPEGCYDISPVTDWITRTILSIIIVLLIAYLPLFLQVLTEQGFGPSVFRLGKHFASFSPLYEVFVAQIYSNSLLSNLTFGGARYIGTGRGFATTRLPFAILYSRFAGSSIYLGMRLMVMLTYNSIILRNWALIYFWVTIIALVISPYLFNPHQFSLTDFIIDYREWLRWLCAGNSRPDPNSWVSHCRLARTKITGYKRKRLGDPSARITGHVPRASKSVLLMSEIIVPLLMGLLLIMAYQFLHSLDSQQKGYNKKANWLLRIVAVSLAPVLINAGLLMMLLPVSLFVGPVAGVCLPGFGSVIAGIAHFGAAFVQVILFMALWWLEGWNNMSRAILGTVIAACLQRFVFGILLGLFLTREFGQDEANIAWWTGKWFGKGMGFHAISLPAREFVCKIVESSLFAADFLIGHVIMFFLSLFCLIPLIDKWHSAMLFWLRPSRQFRPPIYSIKQRSERRRTAIGYGILFVIMFVIFLALIIVPQLGFLPKFSVNLPI